MEASIIINFKTYEESTGDNALKLAKICDEVAKETGAKIIVVPQFADIYRISNEVKIQVYSQGIDNIKFGSYTGHVLAESVKAAGASGSLLNHSERRIKLADIEACIEKLRSLGMVSIVCTNNINTTKAAAAIGPDFVAVEPPELIGSGIPVSQAKPEIVSGSVDAAKEVNPKVGVLCGAGITKGEDIKKAIELGTEGVLLASGVVKAKDPKAVLMDLVGGLG
ncbi:MAG TPA: triose-phosphate isomerase [Candidatus Altiarchaeales archaeon]|nr:triose-phosphate isomerase [Candidatus Altiarchaeales archaeon]